MNKPATTFHIPGTSAYVNLMFLLSMERLLKMKKRHLSQVTVSGKIYVTVYGDILYTDWY